MEKNYCILAIQKYHSMGNLQMSHEHNFRELPLKHVDASLSFKNRELVNNSGSDYKELWYRRIKSIELQTGQPVAVRKNAVLAYEIVTSFSRNADIDMDAWLEANIKWMKEAFGEENVLSMQLHEDETTPHIHTIVVPIDERGKLCAKSFTGGKAKMKRLQTSYGKAMEPLGLVRGEMYSKAKKGNLKRYYKAVDEAAEAKAPQMEAGERVDDYVSRVNKYIQDVKMESLWKEKQFERKLAMEQTKNSQFCAKYYEAVKLQDELEETFNGNMRMVRERLRTYRNIETAVPRKTLSELLQSVLSKFPLEENIRFFNRNKKKKKESSFAAGEEK